MPNILSQSAPVYVVNITVGDATHDLLTLSAVKPGTEGGMPGVQGQPPQVTVATGAYKIGDQFTYAQSIDAA